MTGLVVVTRDLMDGSRVRAAVPDATVVRGLDAEPLVAADLILLDLATGLDPAAAAAIGPPVIAYGPHVDDDALAAARAAGCRGALARSIVFRRLPELLDEASRPPR